MTTAQIRLVGAHEIRVRLGGVSRQRVYQITSRADFPAPVADLAQGKVGEPTTSTTGSASTAQRRPDSGHDGTR